MKKYRLVIRQISSLFNLHCFQLEKECDIPFGHVNIFLTEYLLLRIKLVVTDLILFIYSIPHQHFLVLCGKEKELSINAHQPRSVLKYIPSLFGLNRGRSKSNNLAIFFSNR